MKERTIYALGFFDGVHLGHRALLDACHALGEATGAKKGVITFTTHPDGLVSGVAPRLITSPADRKRLLLEAGIDTVVELTFDKKLMEMPWQEFYRLLRSQYGAAGFVCGEDFRFGSRGAGNAALLIEQCRQDGLPCTVVPQQKLAGTVVSSTHIRALLESGQIRQANSFLGHPHILTGRVVPGRQLGRTMGTPTANLSLDSRLQLPVNGVYACRALVEGHAYPAVTNIGTRPTVGGSHVTVEPWLLDWEGDLYGKELTLIFYEYLRPEKKFPDLTALEAEIRKNAQETRKILENFPLHLGKLMI